MRTILDILLFAAGFGACWFCKEPVLRFVTDLTFSVAESDLKAAEKLVKAAAKEVGAKRVSSAGGIAKLSIVGTGMLGTPGIAARMFRALADGGINIEMISTSEIRITCLVARDQVDKGVRILHQAFELDQELA